MIMTPKTMLKPSGSCYVSFVASYLCLCSCRFVRHVYYDQACNHSLSTIIWYKYKNTSRHDSSTSTNHLQKSIDQQILVEKPNFHQSRPSSKPDCLVISMLALPSCRLKKPF